MGSLLILPFETIRKHDGGVEHGGSCNAQLRSGPLVFAITKHRGVGIYSECGAACGFYQAGLPSLKRRVSVSPPFTTSRASVRSAPSCLILDPVTSI